MPEINGLTWSRTTILDVSSHIAEAGDWKFIIQQPYPSTWVLRGWKGGETLASMLYEYRTLKSAKTGAHAVAVQKGAL